MDKAAIIALAIGFLLFFLQYGVKEMPWFITWPGIAICASVILWKSEIMPVGQSSLLPQIIAILGVFLFAYGMLLYSDQQRAAVSPPMPSGKTEQLGPKPLAHYFGDDFNQTMKSGNDTTLSFGSGEYTIKPQVYMDFNSNAWFGGFFLPKSEYAFPAALYISDNCQEILKPLLSNLYVQSKHPGEPTPTDNQGMSFTKRIYLYHEDDFTLQQRAELLERYKKNDVVLQFRGPEYSTAIWTNERLEALGNK